MGVDVDVCLKVSTESIFIDMDKHIGAYAVIVSVSVCCEMSSASTHYLCIMAIFETKPQIIYCFCIPAKVQTIEVEMEFRESFMYGHHNNSQCCGSVGRRIRSVWDEGGGSCTAWHSTINLGIDIDDGCFEKYKFDNQHGIVVFSETNRLGGCACIQCGADETKTNMLFGLYQ